MTAFTNGIRRMNHFMHDNVLDDTIDRDEG